MATSSNLRSWLHSVDGSIDRSLHETSDIIEVGDFRIDLSQRRVVAGGGDLHLNEAEFDLFLYLSNHPKKLVTPRMKLTTNWHGRRQTDFLRVLLSLRKKLGAAGHGQCLRTEPWIFYRFDATAAL